MCSKLINFDCTLVKNNQKLGIRRPEFLSVKKHALTKIS